mmetsp:Transcript_96248/g.257334  ORF Transcript_96248/g.257334 Transcript_96248/m.257334 type:complete len:230 (-) Transcript_96248:1028-1717(-)
MSELRSLALAAAGGAAVALALVWLGRRAQSCKPYSGSFERCLSADEQCQQSVLGSASLLADSAALASLLPRIRRLPLQQKIKGSSAGIRLVVLVASGKGGVGKSSVATNFAFVLSQEIGASVGLVDADVYGPSLPSLIPVSGLQKSDGADKIEPLQHRGVKLMSFGFLRPGESAPGATGLQVPSSPRHSCHAQPAVFLRSPSARFLGSLFQLLLTEFLPCAEQSIFVAC